MVPDTLQVLYVDDEFNLLDIGKLFLEESREFAVTTALSAPEGIRLLEQEKFDAIISDYQMPGMDGIQFLVEVRSRFGPIPFILFTGRGREEIVIQAINSGVNFYLQKGGDPSAQFAELAHKIKVAASGKRADDLLRKSEEKYRHLIEHSNEAIVVAQDGMLKLVNHRTTDFTGYSEQELLSMPFSAFIHPDDRAMVVERYQKRMKGEDGPPRYAFRTSSKDGSSRWVEISVVVIDWDGRPATLNFITDITERKRVDDSLREEQQFSKLLLDSLPGIFYLYTYPENRLIRWNKQHETLLGYTAEEIKGKLGTDLHLPEHKDAVLKAIDEVMENGQSSVESTLLAKDGRLIPFFFTGVRFEAAGQLYFMGIGIDITERKHSEDALRESEELLRDIIEKNPMSIQIVDREGFTLRVNPAFNRLFGSVPPPDFSIITDLVKSNPGLENHISRVKSGEPVNLPDMSFNPHDIYPELPDVPTRVRAIIFPLNDRHGKPQSFVFMHEDITEQKRTEDALRESEEQLMLAIEGSGLGLWDWDIQTGKTVFNEKWAEIAGYTLAELSPGSIDTWINLCHPDDLQQSDELLKKHFSKQSLMYECEARIRHKDGHWIWVLDSGKVVNWDSNGLPIRMTGTHLDITERKELEKEKEDQAQELQKYSTSLATANKKLKLLSGITRHDISNQLTVQMGYLNMLEKKHPDATHNEYFLKVSTAAKRIAAMVRFAKEYEEIGVHAPTWQDCRTLIDTAAKQAPLGKVMVENNLPASAEVFADPLIVKVFYNLMDNAVRYGGKITTIRFSALERNGDEVLVCEDDGDGVPQDEKEKIFERGFGKNTGLGLALSREILSITGITITETGEPGKGARFEMVVPKGAWQFRGTV